MLCALLFSFFNWWYLVTSLIVIHWLVVTVLTSTVVHSVQLSKLPFLWIKPKANECEVSVLTTKPCYHLYRARLWFGLEPDFAGDGIFSSFITCASSTTGHIRSSFYVLCVQTNSNLSFHCGCCVQTITVHTLVYLPFFFHCSWQSPTLLYSTHHLKASACIHHTSHKLCSPSQCTYYHHQYYTYCWD